MRFRTTQDENMVAYPHRWAGIKVEVSLVLRACKGVGPGYRLAQHIVGLRDCGEARRGESFLQGILSAYAQR